LAASQIRTLRSSAEAAANVLPFGQKANLMICFSSARKDFSAFPVATSYVSADVALLVAALVPDCYSDLSRTGFPTDQECAAPRATGRLLWLGSKQRGEVCACDGMPCPVVDARKCH
jgi:hypothetical protein